MTIQNMTDKLELRELSEAFSILADLKDAAGQGELFTEDGILEFRIGWDGELQQVEGRETLVKAFEATLHPCKALYHINGQHQATISEDGLQAEGIAYCQAMLIQEEDGKDVLTCNSIVYSDLYRKIDGKWYIQRRRSNFLVSEKRIVNE